MRSLTGSGPRVGRRGPAMAPHFENAEERDVLLWHAVHEDEDAVALPDAQALEHVGERSDSSLIWPTCSPAPLFPSQSIAVLSRRWPRACGLWPRGRRSGPRRAASRALSGYPPSQNQACDGPGWAYSASDGRRTYRGPVNDVPAKHPGKHHPTKTSKHDEADSS